MNIPTFELFMTESGIDSRYETMDCELGDEGHVLVWEGLDVVAKKKLRCRWSKTLLV